MCQQCQQQSHRGAVAEACAAVASAATDSYLNAT